MANPLQITVLTAAILWLISLPAALAQDPVPGPYIIEGDVYCEVCRVNFINKLSEPMPGARVKLECKGKGANNVTLSIESEADKKGHYKITADGNHEDETCAVTLVKSTRPDCDEIPKDGWASQPTSIITLTKNNGFSDDARHANPLGFLKKVPAPGCEDLIKELKMSESDDPDN